MANYSAKTNSLTRSTIIIICEVDQFFERTADMYKFYNN